MLPALATSLGAAPEPAKAAARLDGFLAALPSGVQFFALLEANPPLVPLLGRLLGRTPVLADALETGTTTFRRSPPFNRRLASLLETLVHD